jgi:predicted AAA+ superfamily ATPase
MLDRRLYAEVTDRLENIPAVAILGPRQAGKTTLILKLADQRPSLYLDLKLDTDRAKLDDPAPCLLEHSDKLIVLDEIHRVPELFGALRDVIVTNRRNGRRQRTMQVDTHRCSELNVTLKIGWG